MALEPIGREGGWTASNVTAAPASALRRLKGVLRIIRELFAFGLRYQGPRLTRGYNSVSTHPVNRFEARYILFNGASARADVRDRLAFTCVRRPRSLNNIFRPRRHSASPGNARFMRRLRVCDCHRHPTKQDAVPLDAGEALAVCCDCSRQVMALFCRR